MFLVHSCKHLYVFKSVLKNCAIPKKDFVPKFFLSQIKGCRQKKDWGRKNGWGWKKGWGRKKRVGAEKRVQTEKGWYGKTSGDKYGAIEGTGNVEHSKAVGDHSFGAFRAPNLRMRYAAW